MYVCILCLYAVEFFHSTQAEAMRSGYVKRIEVCPLGPTPQGINPGPLGLGHKP